MRLYLCFGCTTLPYKVRYMNDENLLTFSYEKDTNRVYWCDLCERTTNSSYEFYKCNECEVILNTGCLRYIVQYGTYVSTISR